MDTSRKMDDLLNKKKKYFATFQSVKSRILKYSNIYEIQIKYQNIYSIIEKSSTCKALFKSQIYLT